MYSLTFGLSIASVHTCSTDAGSESIRDTASLTFLAGV
jgi:hypothetical protein